MQKKSKPFIILLLLLTFIILPLVALADNNTLDKTLDAFTKNSGLAENGDIAPLHPLDIIMLIIRIALGFLGVIFLIITITSGFKWMTTSSPEEIKKLKAKLINAVIGLIIVLAAYGITTFIADAIFSSLTIESGTV